MNRKIFGLCALIIGVYAGRAFAVDIYTWGDPNKAGSFAIRMICTDYKNRRYIGDKYDEDNRLAKHWYDDDEQKLFQDYHKNGKSVYLARLLDESNPWQGIVPQLYSMLKAKREGNKFSGIDYSYVRGGKEIRRVCRMYFIFVNPRTPGLRKPKRVPEAKDIK